MVSGHSFLPLNKLTKSGVPHSSPSTVLSQGWDLGFHTLAAHTAMQLGENHFNSLFSE